MAINFVCVCIFSRFFCHLKILGRFFRLFLKRMRIKTGLIPDNLNFGFYLHSIFIYKYTFIFQNLPKSGEFIVQLGCSSNSTDELLSRSAPEYLLVFVRVLEQVLVWI